jgi:hypothetical protein
MSNEYANRIRREQYERGYEGVQMLAKFLESHTGVLTVSVNEAQYSQGNMFFPDLVFLNYGAEVKRAELLTSNRFSKGQQFRGSLGSIHINNCGWHNLKAYCRKTSKELVLITVLTFGKQDPLFIGIEPEQVDVYISEFEKRNPDAKPVEYQGKLVYKEHLRKGGAFVGHHEQGSRVPVNVFRLLRDGKVLNHNDNFKSFFRRLPPEYLHGLPATSEMSSTLKGDNYAGCETTR